MEIEAGRVLSGRYRLIRPLGQGSQASVWAAEHLALTTQVAVKLIDPELAKREDARERFRREATAAAQLRSAHVVQVLDHGIDGDQPFIVMELLDGEDLFDRLDKRGRLTLRETSRVVTQVARALVRAHAAGIIHRDLKPENVFLVTNEDDEIVKVFDFGVAKVTDPSKAVMQKTSVGQLIGTPHYMSPEQVKGTGEVDLRADLWALGVITFQCVTGVLPFDSEGVGDLLIKITIGDLPIPSKVVPGLPAAFDAWFAKACNRDPMQRFEGARELAEALARAVRGAHDAPGVGSIPRPAAARAPAVPAFRSTPPPAFEQSGRQAPISVAALKRADAVIPAPVEKVEKKAAPPPLKRPAAPEPDSDDLEEVMSFDEDVPAPKAPPPARPQAVDKGKTPPPALPGSAAPKPPSPPSAPPAQRPAPPPLSPVVADEAPPPAPAAPPAPVAAAAPPPAEEAASSLVSMPAPSAPLAPVVRLSLLPPEAPEPSAAPAAPPPSAAPSAPAAAAPPPAAPPPAAAEPALSGEPPWSQPRQPPPAAPPPFIPSPPSSVPAFGRSDALAIDDPSEFDGSRRKRFTRILAVVLVLGVLIITWIVVSSQLPLRGTTPQPAASSAPVIEPAPKPPEPTIVSDAGAIDPIKPAASASSKPKTKPGRGGRPGPVKKKPAGDDGTIEIPDVPQDDSPPPPAP